MTIEEFLHHVEELEAREGVLTAAIKREWGGRGVDGAEPYLTNGAWRAGHAVVNAIKEIAGRADEP